MTSETLTKANIVQARINEIDKLLNADKVLVIIRHQDDSDEPVSQRFEPDVLANILLPLYVKRHARAEKKVLEEKLRRL